MNDDPTDGRTHAQKFHDMLVQKRLKQKNQVKKEAQLQGGNPDMHDQPDRVNRLLFDCCDDLIREPDAIMGAREIEHRTRAGERRVHDDGDLEAVDDIRRMEQQDFDLI